MNLKAEQQMRENEEVLAAARLQRLSCLKASSYCVFADTAHVVLRLCAHHAVFPHLAHGMHFCAHVHSSGGEQLWTSPNDQIGKWPHLAPGLFAPRLIALLTLERTVELCHIRLTPQ